VIMIDYHEYRLNVCFECNVEECEASDDNIEDCIYASLPLEEVK